MLEMNDRDHSKNIQLKQRLLHVQSELAKYQRIVKKYKEDYHYSLIDALERKNQELQEEVKLKAVEINSLNKEYTKIVDEMKKEKLAHKELQEKNKEIELELSNTTKRIADLESAKLQQKETKRTNKVLLDVNDDNEAAWFENNLKNQKR